MSQFTYFNLKLSSAGDYTVHVTEIKSNVQDWSWEKDKNRNLFWVINTSFRLQSNDLLVSAAMINKARK